MITTEEALDLVLIERKTQNNKWGYPQFNNPFEWASILMEEVGEFAQALNNALLGSANGSTEEVIKEAVQVSAVALSIVEHFSEGKI